LLVCFKIQLDILNMSNTATVDENKDDKYWIVLFLYLYANIGSVQLYKQTR